MLHLSRIPTGLVLAFALSLTAAASQPASPADEPAIRNWSAPPYWSNAVPQTEATEATGREALAAGRQPLGPAPVALPFIALAPCRLVDTRGNGAPLTGGFLPPATVRGYALTGVCGIPANARAVSLNATVVKPTGPGFLTLWPQGGAYPPVSTLNYVGNDIVANAAVVPLGVGGAISMALGMSGGDVLLDTNGYYAAVPSVSSLNALTGDLTLVGGTNVTIAPSAGTITVASPNVVTGVIAGPGMAVTGSATVPTVGIAAGGAVRSLNGATDAVTIAGTGGTTVTQVGNALTVTSPPVRGIVLNAYSGAATGNVTKDSFGCRVFDAAAASSLALDIPLPIGAVITGVQIKTTLPTSSAPMTVILRRMFWNPPSGVDYIASATLSMPPSSPAITALSGLSTSTPASATNSYYLSVSAPAHTGVIYFCGATVQYTVN